MTCTIPKALALAAALQLPALPAAAAGPAPEPMEAIGAQRCADSAKSLTVTFLAPESAALSAVAKVVLATGEESRRRPRRLR